MRKEKIMFTWICRIIYVCILSMGLGIAFAKNGEPQGNYNIKTSLVAFCLEIALLVAGGFFK